VCIISMCSNWLQDCKLRYPNCCLSLPPHLAIVVPRSTNVAVVWLHAAECSTALDLPGRVRGGWRHLAEQKPIICPKPRQVLLFPHSRCAAKRAPCLHFKHEPTRHQLQA